MGHPPLLDFLHPRNLGQAVRARQNAVELRAAAFGEIEDASGTAYPFRGASVPPGTDPRSTNRVQRHDGHRWCGTFVPPCAARAAASAASGDIEDATVRHIRSAAHLFRL
jgi:hypothetical protein